ncbi:MAG: aldo/keto reductase, partial [Clostridiales bacterium]|nr:aldo/keto reductase [Clostridiales bacterium]
GVDYFDYYLLHSLDRSKEKNLRQTNSFDFIQRLKKEGKARFVGFSFHDSAETLDEILTEHPEVDFVQLQINYVDVKMGPAGDWYKTARKHNKPIIVMEPVKGGTLAKMDPPVEAILKAARPEASPASWALRYAASLPGVFTVLSGMSNLEQLKDNLNTFEHFEPITPEDEQALEKAVAELAKISQVPCTACKYCLESCPQGIAIPQIFSAYNELRRVTRGEQWNSKMLYDSIPAGHRADDCVSCAACEEHCPQGIHIREELQNAAQALAG